MNPGVEIRVSGSGVTEWVSSRSAGFQYEEIAPGIHVLGTDVMSADRIEVVFGLSGQATVPAITPPDLAQLAIVSLREALGDALDDANIQINIEHR